MDALATTRTPGTSSDPSITSRSSARLNEDVASLTSYNPFSEEDENDQSSYALMSSLISKVKSTFTTPLSSNTAIPTPSGGVTAGPSAPPNERWRPSNSVIQSVSSNESSRSSTERPFSLNVVSSNPAPPLVSLTPVVSEAPSYNIDYDRQPAQGAFLNPSMPESQEGGVYGTTIPGFAIQDDARSIRTTTSIKRSASVSKVIRRIRGEGLSRDYWMDDENCKECYDCKSVFTTWRRKHHCRICGQIFCSRCASNIIKGSRFGHDGMIRICNLCLEKLATVDEDEDDDRRSVASGVSSPFAAHQLGTDSVPFGLGRHPQSPFAASQLFGRTDEPFNLFSIAETRRPISGSDESGFGSRPITPPDDLHDDPWGLNHRRAIAPFRRGLADDERDPDSIASAFSHDNSPIGPGSKTPVDFPVTVPVVDCTSSIQFPPSSPEYAPESPGPHNLARSRYGSYADFDPSTPFIRSRVQSRLTDFMMVGEPGWRTRRESTAYAQELNLLSMFHLRLMLRQMLTKEDIPNLPEWEETLLKMALRIARELAFTAHPQRQGPDMDVRRYVKIKKIPGGAPKDSEYVDGAVITKNVAHKTMSRLQRNPRVMLVTFPLEFSRVEGQYMHFGQILRQEKEYLGNLASRIAALRPHVVLVEKSVSRLALDALAEHNIAVARGVKPSAIQTVARMTQGDVFSSMDKLALEPRLGHCAKFRIQTFDHPLIPGRRKTYMRFEGCNREMGCTIVLRGGDLETLRRVKKVTRFLTFIVRSLKLETHLWKDSVISLPALTPDAVPASYEFRPKGPKIIPLSLPFSPSSPRVSSPIPNDTLLSTSVIGMPETNEADLPDEDADQLRLSRRIQQSLDPYLYTFISVSATLRFLPPHPIRRMKELDEELIRVKRAWEDEVVRREEKQPVIQFEMSATPTPFAREDINAQIESLACPPLPKTPTSDDIVDEPGYFDYQGGSTSLQPTLLSSVLPSPVAGVSQASTEEMPLPIKTVDDIALESQLSLVKWQHQEQQRVWEWYLRKNFDDFVVEKYQSISLWEFTLPIGEYGLHAACFPPSLRYITYYGENDCTLGQFVEASVADIMAWSLDPKQPICTGKGCNQPLARHCKVYVHNETRLFVAVEPWDGQIIGLGCSPAPELITTWSACRICGSATPFIPVSEEMQRYSFSKFLELHFYPAEVNLVQGAGCEHNIYQHHIRYFATRGMTVRFQADPIVLHEIVYPPMRIRIRPETQLMLKNADFERLVNRNTLWYSALVDDLKLINIDAATGDEEADAKLTADIHLLILRAESERAEVGRMINEIYRDSAPTDTLALNLVRSYLQDKIVAWQADFDKLPKPKGPFVDKSGRRMSTFGSVRAMWPRRYELSGAYDNQMPSSSVSEAEESFLPSMMRRVTGESFASASSASEASEPEGFPETTRKDTTTVQTSIPPAPSEPDPAAPGGDGQIAGLPPMPSTSDPESDSTIGAPKAETTALTNGNVLLSQDEDAISTGARIVKPGSRLPRRQSKQPSVAELVKKYQEYLPPQGVEELAKTALSPRLEPLSPQLDSVESDQESAVPLPQRHLTKNRTRRLPARKPSTSDFEQGYAANVAPRYLTRRHRQASQSTRIPGPAASSFDSREPSRQPSPEKRPPPPLVTFNSDVTVRPGRASPTPGSRPHMLRNPSTSKPARNLGKDKAPSRPSSTPAPKSTLRRSSITPGGKVSNIAKHFERINKDTERANRRYAVIRGRRARPVASARAKVEILDSVKDAVKDESDSSDSSSEADDEGGDDDDTRKSLDKPSPASSGTLPQVNVQEELEPVKASVDLTKTDTDTDSQAPAAETSDTSNRETTSVPPSPSIVPVNKGLLSPQPSDLELGPTSQERNSLLKALSGFWPQQMAQTRNRVDYEVDDPMSDPEHIFRDSSMVVRTDEPTSIIALALNSPQYRDMLAKSRAEKRQAREPKLTDGGEAFMPDDRSVADSTSTWGVVNVEVAEGANPTDELRVPSSKLPWAITFESGGLTISCTLLYPEQFDALRRTYDCEKSIIESLARCVKWNASGGKSGSAFLKTRDDRFIAKEMSRTEVQTMETFAPAYFDYMSSAVSANRPTLLAKVFGCYKISFKKTGKDKGSGRSKATQMNLIVMENLFYDRRFSKIYDLKGSTRNRHVQSTGRENEVLLDENLVQTAHLAPFYVREHSKRILRGALYNDSKFLADINVMDYSLVVGVDSNNNELVVGIVDYVRTYTWDKKLESWVKESTFLGGAGRGEPTIVTPKQYRQRFVSAMERYFPLVPDRWMKQKDAPEEDGNSLLDLWPDW
ncbi:hypothetical protein BV25DRAFT_1986869 [Artomyces pyxidatus]|uniref:Uncharacterized protein n=1 Tax=Artomyces pyxidatus TaxID=48021 RepID=A0ACB8TI12_9AGAM|nr:hypothetical protein BV25DRAFT_1986869 [Artomyces pyxidatus]